MLCRDDAWAPLRFAMYMTLDMTKPKYGLLPRAIMYPHMVSYFGFVYISVNVTWSSCLGQAVVRTAKGWVNVSKFPQVLNVSSIPP